MNAPIRFEGVLAYPVTPLNATGDQLDLAALSQLIDRLITAGVHALIPLGSAGEFPYLSLEEREAAAEVAIQQTARRIPVIVGVSALSTADSVTLAKHADRSGADGIMVSFPTYYGLTSQEVAGHVRAIADNSSLPIVLYNNPFTSQVDLDVQLLARLAEIESVVAVKEATMDTNRVSLIWRAFGDRFAVLGGGYDPYAFPTMALGVRGWSTAMANLVPEQCVNLFDALVIRQELDEARRVNERLLPLAGLLIEFGLAKALKAGLEILGVPAGPVRAPLAPLDDEQIARLRDAIQVAQPVLVGVASD